MKNPHSHLPTERRAGRRRVYGRADAFTLVEVLIAVALIATLSTFAVPAALNQLRQFKTDQAIVDLTVLAFEISTFEGMNGRLPGDLRELETPLRLDPWGRPYQYLSSEDRNWKSQARKDRFLVPLNSDYDLYSMGPDGESRPPLTAKVSRDDIVRANNGGYIGLASEF